MRRDIPQVADSIIGQMANEVKANLKNMVIKGAELPDGLHLCRSDRVTWKIAFLLCLESGRDDKSE